MENKKNEAKKVLKKKRKQKKKENVGSHIGYKFYDELNIYAERQTNG